VPRLKAFGAVRQTKGGVEGMKLTLKLFASLTDHLPPEARHSNHVVLAVPDDSDILSVIEPFNLPPKSVHLVLVNGRYIEPTARATYVLAEGDVLAIWPPIAGG